MTVVSLEVLGLPAPQGSKRAFVRGGRAVLVEGGSARGGQAVASWREAVRAEAQRWCWAHRAFSPFSSAVRVEATFLFPRPPSVSAKRRPWPSVKPDVDKVARATLDALTGVLFRDDALVCDLHVRKAYTPGPPRAVIHVMLMTEEAEAVA